MEQLILMSTFGSAKLTSGLIAWLPFCGTKLTITSVYLLVSYLWFSFESGEQSFCKIITVLIVSDLALSMEICFSQYDSINLMLLSLCVVQGV